MKNRCKYLGLVLAVICLLPAAPAFGGEARKRIAHIVDQSDQLADVEAEILFGRELAARILGHYGFCDDPKLNRYVNLVGRAVALHSGRPELTYHFGVLDSEELNAFAAPGGYVFITRAALLKMQNEAQLACVLGHEIAHVTERHVIRELNIRGADGSAVAGIAGLISGATSGTVKSLEQAMDRAAEILFKNGYKIQDEIQADAIGMLMAASAGYDPMALQDFLSREKRFEKEDETYKGDHPAHMVRVEKMNMVLAAGNAIRTKKATLAERFYANVNH